MNEHEPIDISPTSHNAKDKYDVLDWEQLPHGTCELNFRLPSGEQAHHLPAAVWLIVKSCCAGVLLWLLLSAGPARFIWEHTSLMVLGIVLTVVVARIARGSSDLAESFRNAVVGLGLIAVAGLFVLISVWGQPGLTVAAFLIGGVLTIAAFGDAVATHYVFWVTANHGLIARPC